MGFFGHGVRKIFCVKIVLWPKQRRPYKVDQVHHTWLIALCVCCLAYAIPHASLCHLLRKCSAFTSRCCVRAEFIKWHWIIHLPNTCGWYMYHAFPYFSVGHLQNVHQLNTMRLYFDKVGTGNQLKGNPEAELRFQGVQSVEFHFISAPPRTDANSPLHGSTGC